VSDLVVEVPAESREDGIKALGKEVTVMDSPEGPLPHGRMEAEVKGRTNPAVRRFLVQVDPPSLESTAADLERVCYAGFSTGILRLSAEPIFGVEKPGCLSMPSET